MSTQELYERHHAKHRNAGYSILENQRGAYFSRAIGTNKRVLDIGCRDGALTKHFISENSVLGIDIDTQSLARAEELGIRTKQVDLMGDWKEIEGEKFDVIVAGEVLEHLFYPEEVMHKISLHLKKGGLFIGSVPNAFSLKNRLRYFLGTRKHTPLADPTHITQFSARELQYMLGQSFKEVHIDGLGTYARLASIKPDWFAFDLIFIAKT